MSTNTVVKPTVMYSIEEYNRGHSVSCWLNRYERRLFYLFLVFLRPHRVSFPTHPKIWPKDILACDWNSWGPWLPLQASSSQREDSVIIYALVSKTCHPVPGPVGLGSTIAITDRGTTPFFSAGMPGAFGNPCIASPGFHLSTSPSSISSFPYFKVGPFGHCHSLSPDQCLPRG